MKKTYRGLCEPWIGDAVRCCTERLHRRAKSAFAERPQCSQAMNVMLAAEYMDDPATSTVKDVSKANIAQSAGDGGEVGFDASHALTHPACSPSRQGGLALGMSAMSLLLSSPRDPLSYSKVLAWMPRSLAASPSEARRTLQGMIDDALDAALLQALASPLHTVPRNPQQPGRVVISGGNCLSEGARCDYWLKVNFEPIEATAPAMLGSIPVWTWRHVDRRDELIAAAFWPSATVPRFTDPNRDWLPDMAVYKAMSKRLPDWIFLYLAPGEVSLGDARGFLKFALVLNKGEPLYFLSPGN